MPIEGRSARECAETFRAHLSALLAATIAPKVPLRLMGSAATVDEFAVVFQEGDKPRTVPLATKHGTLFLHLAQLLHAQKEGKRFRLRTLAYWYRLQATGGVLDEALLRWEYERTDPAKAGQARHHFQAPAEVQWGKRSLSLNKVHVPTGWITIEELIRFLIWDLGVKPQSEDWPHLLAQSEDKFFQEFSGKRRVAPA